MGAATVASERRGGAAAGRTRAAAAVRWSFFLFAGMRVVVVG